ncbi:hypothetical protein BHE74_00059129, partial [Ensete ventricosum]
MQPLIIAWTTIKMDIRCRQDIHSRSKISILEARSDLYAAKIDDKVCMKIGEGS